MTYLIIQSESSMYTVLSDGTCISRAIPNTGTSVNTASQVNPPSCVRYSKSGQSSGCPFTGLPAPRTTAYPTSPVGENRMLYVCRAGLGRLTHWPPFDHLKMLMP